MCKFFIEDLNKNHVLKLSLKPYCPRRLLSQFVIVHTIVYNIFHKIGQFFIIQETAFLIEECLFS